MTEGRRKRRSFIASIRILAHLSLGSLLVTLVACRELDDLSQVDYPTEGLVLYYSFDHAPGTLVPDESGSGRDANMFGDTKRVPGIRYGAVAFDGSPSSFVEDVDGADRLEGLQAVTLSVWIRSEEVNTDAGILICEPPASHDRALSLRYDKEGARTGSVNGIKGGVTLQTSESNFETLSNLQITEWQHLVMAWKSGEGLRLYVNGKLQELNYNPAFAGSLTGMSTLLVGKGGKDQQSSWKGVVDELFLFDRVLSQEEITSLYNRVGGS